MRNNKGQFIKGHKLLGNGIGEYARTHSSFMKGKKHTAEANEKNRIAHLGKVTMKGKDHYNWKGGITPLRKKLYFSREYQLWRTAVFMRDDYTCKSCNTRGGELNVDHIKPWALYPELRFAIDNGRTLCVPCHRQTDTWGVRVGQNI